MKKASIFYLLIATPLLIFPYSATALNYGLYAQTDLGLGISSTNSGDMTLTYKSIYPLFDKFKSQKKTIYSMPISLQAGISGKMPLDPIFEAGLAAYWFNTQSIKGKLFFNATDTSPGQYLYNYSYKLNLAALMAVGRLFYINRTAFSPYIEAGAGLAEITKSSRKITPLPSNPPYGMTFGRRTDSNFAVQVGVGIRARINDHFSIVVGYRYFNLGKAYIGKIVSTTNPSNNLYSKAIQIHNIYAGIQLLS